MTHKAKIEKILSELGEIKRYDQPQHIALRSRDYFWYSPILNETLADALGDIILIPQNEAEIRQIATLAARHRIPLTIRGGGTGNYGQCVPLDGGIVMDMTRFNRVLEISDDWVHVEAGARIAAIDDAVNLEGKALLMFPSTRRIATIGGFISGGSGGIGSLRHGMLRDDGNVLYAKIMTLEETPQIIELHGSDVHKIQHAYGTNGIILELKLGLTQKTEWIHTAALFDGYDRALRAAMAAQETGLDIYLLSPVERRFSAFYEKLGDKFPADRDAVFAMVAPQDVEKFRTLMGEFGGHLSFTSTLEELHAAGLPPAFECGWNHTTLMALKKDKSWTYLQVAYPRPFDPDLVLRQMERYGESLFMHHEVARLEGENQFFALPLVKFTNRDALYQMIREFEADGCEIYDPHVYTIEEGGIKEIDDNQISFKKLADPYGLMNPGKTSGWSADMQRN